MKNAIEKDHSTVDDIILNVSNEKGCLHQTQVDQPDKHYFIVRKVHLGVRDRISGEFLPQLEACTLDMSLSDIRLLTETALELDAIYDVDVKAFGDAAHFVRIRIVRCKQLLKHTFEISALFLDK